ncbi:MAG: NPCBM/NEW2 domain-containing protein [Thermoguttaceae bacterium]
MRFVTRIPAGFTPIVALVFLAAHSGRAQDMTVLRGKDAPAGAIWIDSLDVNKIEQGWSAPRAGCSAECHPLTIHGVGFVHGIGTYSVSEMWIDLKGSATKFVSAVGVDDDAHGKGSVGFEVWADGKKLADTGVMRGGNEAKLLTVDLRGVKQLLLRVNDGGDGGDYDRADWAGGILELVPGAKAQPESILPPWPAGPPIAHEDSPRPALHSPTITGATPGKPFLFLVPASGEPPLHFAAENLPAGLTLDPRTGIISGSLAEAGTTVVAVTVKNPLGTARGNLTIVGGPHKLALTPPMGWNSWLIWAGVVTDEKVRAAADAMVKFGLAAHGFQYVNIDDTWAAPRNAKGEIQCNSRFPDMKALADYVHSKGLKLGIYSSPGPYSCGGYTGSYQHERQDADTFARWGVDYLKYDWCSYSSVSKETGRQAAMKPFRVMGDALDQCHRDIVYSLCQYGSENVWEWGDKVGANCWRTTDDITDTWRRVSEVGFTQDGHEKYAGPGHWNDPDTLVVGKVGGVSTMHRTHLEPNEQVSQVSLWCLLAAPLLMSCDLSVMDRFTQALVTNSEVLAVDQDPLGRPAGRVKRDGPREVWARPLADGTLAVGLFNRENFAVTVRIDWPELKLSGPPPANGYPVRDLWQQKDLGRIAGGYETTVARHGAVLLKIGAPRP